MANALATTAVLTDPGTTLHLSSAAVLLPAAITDGMRYWIVATTVGLGQGTDVYTLGGHVQNSIYNDDGTFWYSNEPDGLIFFGRQVTPELAICAGSDASAESVAPEPGTWTGLLLGLAVCGTRCRVRR